MTPGGETGLLIETRRSIRNGKKTSVVREYAFDRGLFAELRETLKQAAIEKGQWGEIDRTEEDRGPDYSHLSVEELRERQAIFAETRAKLDALDAARSNTGLIEAAPGSVEQC